jgi:hypothetical protein
MEAACLPGRRRRSRRSREIVCRRPVRRVVAAGWPRGLRRTAAARSCAGSVRPSDAVRTVQARACGRARTCLYQTCLYKIGVQARSNQAVRLTLTDEDKNGASRKSSPLQIGVNVFVHIPCCSGWFACKHMRKGP